MNSIAAAQLLANSALAQAATPPIVPPVQAEPTTVPDAAVEITAPKVARDFGSIVERIKSGEKGPALQEDKMLLVQHDKAIELLGGIIPTSADLKHPGTWMAGRAGIVADNEKLFADWAQESINRGVISGHETYAEFNNAVKEATGLSARELFKAAASHRPELFLDANEVDSFAKLAPESLSNVPSGLDMEATGKILKRFNRHELQNTPVKIHAIPDDMRITDEERTIEAPKLGADNAVKSKTEAMAEIVKLLPQEDKAECSTLMLRSQQDLSSVAEILSEFEDKNERTAFLKEFLAQQ